MFLFFKSSHEKKDEITEMEKCLDDWKPLKTKNSSIKGETVVNIGGGIICTILGLFLFSKLVRGLEGEIEDAKNKLEKNHKLHIEGKTSIKYDNTQKEFSIKKVNDKTKYILDNINFINYVCKNHFENKKDKIEQFWRKKNIKEGLSYKIYDQIEKYFKLLDETVKENASNITEIIEKINKEDDQVKKNKKIQEFLENLNYFLNNNMDLSDILIFLFNYRKIEEKKEKETKEEKEIREKREAEGKEKKEKYNNTNKDLIKINEDNEKEFKNIHSWEQVYPDVFKNIIEKNQIFKRLQDNMQIIINAVNDANFLQSHISLEIKPFILSLKASFIDFYQYLNDKNEKC